MGSRGSGREGDGTLPSPPRPRRITGDRRKSSEYVLVPGHPTGKDRLFLGVLGYRARNEEDAVVLLALYLDQAREQIAQGRYTLGERDRHGQRYAIEIELGGWFLWSGWILRADGTLRLATPFAGFSH